MALQTKSADPDFKNKVDMRIGFSITPPKLGAGGQYRSVKPLRRSSPTLGVVGSKLGNCQYKNFSILLELSQTEGREKLAKERTLKGEVARALTSLLSRVRRGALTS